MYSLFLVSFMYVFYFIYKKLMVYETLSFEDTDDCSFEFIKMKSIQMITLLHITLKQMMIQVLWILVQNI
jgi:hypothetical protein